MIAARTIQKFIQANWSDERLAWVRAFNADGKMRWTDPCGCLLGVTLSSRLHRHPEDVCTDPFHYTEAHLLPASCAAESAYLGLGLSLFACIRYLSFDGNYIRQRRLDGILSREMCRRERERALVAEPSTCQDDEAEEVDQIAHDQAAYPKEALCS